MKRPTLCIFECGTTLKTALLTARNQSFTGRAAALCTLILILPLTCTFGQSKSSYDFAFNEINKMLMGQSPLDFKRAVFLTENAFHSNRLDYKEFCQKIDGIEVQLKQFMNDKGVVQTM